ncbi:flavin reductase family protein [Pseudozobellia thermophila]|uniref:NADH-FMN oxidoreductase RutF, flavin reductase (DIM6/NTAB) family n=1 Tax=Pseudozobellia thermophila TaxID=192903 RepID=A0A1M6AJK3_9FLAO|nr:flavin reductase family protein [Pseudozobellia thermophila]SHI36625.1 NADH-FMN oxidoreductase RutF, flavin reductase (DIM6/NTAB) family [Pseudozobellia thermophila]
MLSILPDAVPTGKLHGYLLGAVGPRPIAFASTIDEKGRPNLSPFSFFNVFGSNPPILIFSPSRRVRDNTTKHTLQNVLLTMEVVINVVDYDMVEQMSLSSTEYPKGENEFKKAGLTMVRSDIVSPYRVGESPVQFECKVTKVEALGKEGGAGNLIFSEVVKIHIATRILDEGGHIDPRKIDQVARMGGNWYSRANKGLFEVPKPLSELGVGVDRIPAHIRSSKVLTGNDLGRLGNVARIPDADEVKAFVASNMEVRTLISSGEREQLERKAKEYLQQNDALSAWKVLLAG